MRKGDRVGNIDQRVCGFGASDVVLDAGTGGGHLLETLCLRCRTVHGTDIRPQFLRLIRERMAQNNLVLTVADLTRMPFKSASFSRVICTEVLEHLPDPTDAIAELHRVLGAKGVAVIAVPTCFSERLYGRLNRRYDRNQGQHVTILQRDEWMSRFETAGFRKIAVRNENFWPALYWTVRNVLRVEYDAASGQVAGDRLLDKMFWLGAGAIDKLSCGVVARLGATVYAKSWYFYLVDGRRTD